MEDQLVTFETDMLARDKGFYLSQPTQSLLQRWLREEYDLHICIEFFIGGGTGLSEVYSAEVYNLTETLCLMGFVYDTYEMALEAALKKALTLI